MNLNEHYDDGMKGESFDSCSEDRMWTEERLLTTYHDTTHEGTVRVLNDMSLAGEEMLFLLGYESSFQKVTRYLNSLRSKAVC